MVRNNNLPDRPTRERARGADKSSVTSLTGSKMPQPKIRNHAMMRRSKGRVKLGVKKSMAARLPISDSVGYGSTTPVSARIFSPCAIASVQVAINSPACAPTMVTPRILPFLSVTTLMWPRVSRSVWARSLS